MTANLNQLTIHEAADLLSRGECSSVDLVGALQAAASERDGAIGGYIDFDEADALAQAEAADRARADGRDGSLLGIPIAVKDNLNINGRPCTAGSKILAGYTSLYDATVIARLREAGAIFVGRANMDEFAMGSSTENSGHGVTRNPWDAERVPGGSSGGSAAVVAADEALAALGSDTGGSIRQPASFCGCVGLKPSYGRVSRYGLIAYASSLDQIGPLTKDVRDAAILLRAIAGRDGADSSSVDVPIPDYEADLEKGVSGMRLGVPREYFGAGMDPEVEQAVRKAIDRCAQLGAEIVELSLPNTEYAIGAYYIIATAEASANLARFDGVRYGYRADGAKTPIEMYRRTRAAGFGTEVKRRIILGTYVLSSGYSDRYYHRAQQVRTLIRDDFTRAFETCDAILTPTAPTPAFKVGELAGDPLQMYLADVCTVPVNLAGICGVSVPCGFTAQSLPIGLQILGPSFKEETILRVAAAYEAAEPWSARRPFASASA